jgi:hypothetical protein
MKSRPYGLGVKDRLIGVVYHALVVPNDSSPFPGTFLDDTLGCVAHTHCAHLSIDITTTEEDGMHGVDGMDGDGDGDGDHIMAGDLNFARGVGGDGQGGAVTVEFDVAGGVEGEGREEGPETG